MELRDINYLLDKFFVLKRAALFTLIGGRDAPVHFTQLPILEYILDHDDCTQIEIADYFGLSASSVAVSTKRMQKAGLIEKAEDENNLRRKKLRVTAEGMRAAEEGRKVFDEFDEKVYSGISGDELSHLSDMIGRMIDNIGSSHECKPPEFFGFPS